MMVYIVEALRWGDRERHSYVLGVWSDYDEAVAAAEEHTEHRGGKYQCFVQQCRLGSHMDTDPCGALLYQTEIGATPVGRREKEEQDVG
jgi:hypothetical protein